eukprot:403335118
MQKQTNSNLALGANIDQQPSSSALDKQKNNKYEEFHDEENPHIIHDQQDQEQLEQRDNDKSRTRKSSSKYSQSASPHKKHHHRRHHHTKGKSKLEKIMSSDKNILEHTPFQKDFDQQTKLQQVKSIIYTLMCSYWILNSTLGFYIIYEYPSLAQTYPLTWLYLIAFSSKWLLAGIAALGLLVLICIIMKFWYGSELVCQNTIGAFPVMYIMTIVVSYMASLYYGVVIMKEIYLYRQNAQEDSNSLVTNPLGDDYKFYDNTQSILIQIFVLNEIIVGATIIVSFFTSLCCGQLNKSKHLQQLEGRGFGIDEEYVKKVQMELQESRVRTESIRKELSIIQNDPTRLSQMKEDMIKEYQQETQNRTRSLSKDPNQQL